MGNKIILIIRSATLLLLTFMASTQPVLAAELNSSHIDFGVNHITQYQPGSTGCTASSVSSQGVSKLEGFELPATHGKTGDEGKVDDNGNLVTTGHPVRFSKFAKLGQPWRDFYITMRWNYTDWNWNGTNTGIDDKQLAWMSQKARLVLVTNPRTGKSIIADAMEAGPGPWTGVDPHSNNDPKQGWKNPQHGTPPAYTGRVSGFPPAAIDALGAKQGMAGGSGDDLVYSWAPDQNATPGPTSVVAKAGIAQTGGAAGSSNCSSVASDIIQGAPGSIATVYYSQHDSRWANVPFRSGGGTIDSSGCGPTSFAMVVATLTGNQAIHPDTVMPLWQQKGWNTPDGTSWSAFSNGPAVYGLKSETLAAHGDKDGFITATELQAVANAVRNGKLVIVTGKGSSSGLFTSAGHVIVVRGVTADGQFAVNDPKDDPVTKKSTNKLWPASVFLSEARGAWAISK